jgi:hypothetical protein
MKGSVDSVESETERLIGQGGQEQGVRLIKGEWFQIHMSRGNGSWRRC